MVNVLTEFPEVTKMASGRRLEVYWGLLLGQGLLSIRIGGRFKSGIPP